VSVSAGITSELRQRRPILSYQLERLPSVMNSAVRVHTTSLHSFISLYWLKAPERIYYQLTVVAFRCCHGTAPTYVVDELFQPADLRIRSASTSSLPVRHTRLSTVADRAFLIAAARTWNALTRHVTSAPSLPVFSRPYYALIMLQCCVCLSVVCLSVRNVL